MLVRVIQQQTANQPKQLKGPSQLQQSRQVEQPEQPERPERPELPERPEKPERPEQGARSSSPDVIGGPGNQIIIRNGVIPPIPPIPPIPNIQIHTGMPQDIIPPQAVDISYAFFAMVAFIIIGWPFSRAFGRRLERSAASKALPPAVTDQLQRIEQGVEAMALEVERISEAQRYFTKVQAGRAGEASALPSSDRR
jgi:hypothetical protein